MTLGITYKALRWVLLQYFPSILAMMITHWCGPKIPTQKPFSRGDDTRYGRYLGNSTTLSWISLHGFIISYHHNSSCHLLNSCHYFLTLEKKTSTSCFGSSTSTPLLSSLSCLACPARVEVLETIAEVINLSRVIQKTEPNGSAGTSRHDVCRSCDIPRSNQPSQTQTVYADS